MNFTGSFKVSLNKRLRYGSFFCVYLCVHCTICQEVIQIKTIKKYVHFLLISQNNKTHQVLKAVKVIKTHIYTAKKKKKMTREEEQVEDNTPCDSMLRDCVSKLL